MKSTSRPIRRQWILRAALWLVLALAVVALGWFRWVYVQVEQYAGQDHAAPADAIGVFGAAEYDGRPSPVYRARLDHAFVLYQHGIAPLLITLGGNGGDEYNEGTVGREYLMSLGVPESDYHRRDPKPQYGGVGPPHRRYRPRQRRAAAGDCQRRNAPVPHP
jgi:vancomycin permeability regulator SanA